MVQPLEDVNGRMWVPAKCVKNAAKSVRINVMWSNCVTTTGLVISVLCFQWSPYHSSDDFCLFWLIFLSKEGAERKKKHDLGSTAGGMAIS
jgi:hypothetical protein